MSPIVIVVAALVVGYVAKRSSVYDDGIGARVGVVGGFSGSFGQLRQRRVHPRTAVHANRHGGKSRVPCRICGLRVRRGRVARGGGGEGWVPTSGPN